MTNELETKISGLFIAGDGAGLTQGVIAAAVTGVSAGRTIAQRL